MKKPCLITAFFLINVIQVLAQCNPYYNLKEGTEYVMETFNEKGKKLGRNENKVTSFTGANNEYNAVLQVLSYDDKNKLVTESNFNIKCNGGNVLLDMKNFIPQESMKAYEKMTATFKGDFLEFPANLSVGQTLKDGTIDGEFRNEGSSDVFASMNVKLINRKVEAKENITTPAGSFDSYKITYDMEITSKMMGINIPFRISAVEWVTENYGVVKSESYNKKGKMIGYTLLTSYK